MTAKAYRQPAFIQIRARLTGSVQWLCPRCSHMNAGARQNSANRGFWRTGVLHCTRCETPFQVGLHFHTKPHAQPPPFSARFLPRPAVWTTHALNQPDMGSHAVGRAVGTLFWVCDCQTIRRSTIRWEDGYIDCPTCKRHYYVALLLHLCPNSGRRGHTTPLDWILPIWDTEHVENP